ncbi:cytochrome c maturation protein CcmE [uncultured Cocleimonas sp.]|uniref:cytochrome c maturation protein CcmE n=1 Tax=uncultured Cocleimonas sp. TaxID=1051587 RepID=UPI0026034542|nr:cytochrome c maturation protein CcmE [uncultured Cocleimonas sp.]
MKPRNKRLAFVLLALVSVGAASALISKAMKGNLAYLHSPEEVLNGVVPKGQVFRLGGLVKEGSLERSDSKLEARFIVRDNRDNEITVVTDKILPDLFKEGKSQVSRGKMADDGLFYADEVLAKHDAEYMPQELKDTLEKEHTPQAASSTKGGTY